MSSLVALVLGGGRGTRLHPLTAERAKPAVPLCGRYRLIDIPLSNCIHSGIRRIYVLTQFNSTSLNRHVSNCYKFDAFSNGFIEILAAEQTDEGGDWFQGTADAVRKHLRTFRNHGGNHFLILSGDQLYRMDYRQMMATHIRNSADITVAVLPVDRQVATRFGILKVRGNGRIHKFVEKPQTDGELADLVSPESVFRNYGLNVQSGNDYLASMGVYIFRWEVLEEILTQEESWIDFGKDVIPKSLRTRRVYAHPFTGFWEDIGTVRSYYDVSLSMASADPPFELYDPHHPIFTRPRYLPGSRLNETLAKDTIICEGCDIEKASITSAIIGIRTIIHPGVKVSKSIIMGADYYDEPGCGDAKIPLGIGAGTSISGAIVDKNARIGRNCVIRGSQRLRDAVGDGWAIRDGLVVVTKNAVIPDGSRIGG